MTRNVYWVWVVACTAAARRARNLCEYGCGICKAIGDKYSAKNNVTTHVPPVDLPWVVRPVLPVVWRKNTAAMYFEKYVCVGGGGVALFLWRMSKPQLLGSSVYKSKPGVATGCLSWRNLVSKLPRILARYYVAAPGVRIGMETSLGLN